VSREKEAVRGTSVLTDAQVDELKKMFQWYVRVTALGAVREISDSQMAKNTWLLYEAGYTQPEIAKILGTSQPTISRVLSGKLGKGKGQEEEEK
jgi:DNA-binding MarR family transcriptional regulator